MSTIVIIQQPHAVSFITDTGQYDPDTGAVVAMRSKVLVFPNAPVAFAWRGDGGDWPDRLFKHCKRLRTLTDIVVAASRYMRALMERGTKDDPNTSFDIECYFAGWNEKHKVPMAVWFTNLERPVGDDAAPPFSIRQAPLLACVPAFSQPIEEVLGWMPTPDTWNDLDPVRDGLAMIEAVRRSPQRRGMIVAAGAAELTQVRDDRRINRFRLRDWGDTIGEPVSVPVGPPEPAEEPIHLPSGPLH